MKALILVVAVVLVGACTSLPFTPSDPVPTETERITAALDLIRASDARLPIAPTERLIDWFNDRVVAFEVFDSETLGGFADNSHVYLSRRSIMTAPPLQLAGTLLHEASHKYLHHTCGFNAVAKMPDLDRPGEFGPWEIQAWWLDVNGDHGNAASIRRNQICHGE